MLKNEIAQIPHFKGLQNEEMINSIIQTFYISSSQHTNIAEFFSLCNCYFPIYCQYTIISLFIFRLEKVLTQNR